MFRLTYKRPALKALDITHRTTLTVMTAGPSDDGLTKLYTPLGEGAVGVVQRSIESMIAAALLNYEVNGETRAK